MVEIICLENLNRYCKLLYESSVARNRNVTTTYLIWTVIEGLILVLYLNISRPTRLIIFNNFDEILKVKYNFNVILHALYHIGASIFVLSTNLCPPPSSLTTNFFPIPLCKCTHYNADGCTCSL